MSFCLAGRASEAADTRERVVITFVAPDAAGAPSQRVLRKLHRLAVARGVSAVRTSLGRFRPIAKFSLIPAVVAELTPDEIEHLRTDPAVAQVAPNRRVHKMALPNASAQQSVGVAQARADFGVAGELSLPPTIAIIDSGFNPTHEALSGKLTGANGDPADPCYIECTAGTGSCWHADPVDVDGHGTHVAAIALGSPPPPHEVYAGVCPECRLAAVKVLDDQGNGFVADVIAALDWAVAHRESCAIRVVNLSLGGDRCGRKDDPDVVAVNRAVAAGLVVVAAAGNAGPAKRTISSPGAAADAITIGSVAADLDSQSGGFYLSAFSSRGPSCASSHRQKPDLLAPGERVVSADASDPSGYIAHSGTSMATPFVSGLAGLMLLMRPATLPAFGPADVKNALMRTALVFEPRRGDSDFGAGLVDGYAALGAAGALCDAPGACVRVPRGRVVRLTGSLRPGRPTNYQVTLADQSEPIGATLIADQPAGSTGSVALQLFDASVLIREAAHARRQEQIGYWPSHAGPFELVVRPLVGVGRYRLYVWTAGTVTRLP